MDYFKSAMHWLRLTAPHLLRRVAAGLGRGGRFNRTEWPLRQGTRGRWRGPYAKDSGVRHYEIRDKRYTEADINAMPDDVLNRARFTFFCIYRHKELKKPLTGTFTIAGLKKRIEQETERDSILAKLKAPLPPPIQSEKTKEREVR